MTNSRGGSLVSSIIVLALASVSSLMLANYVVGVRSTSQRLDIRARCVARADSIIALFKNADNKLFVSNWHPYFASGTTPFLNPPNFSSGLPRLTGTVTLAPLGNPTNTQVNAWVLLDSGANWATSLFNQGAFCQNQPTGMPFWGTPISSTMVPFNAEPLQIPNSPIDSTERLYLNIQRVDFTTQAVDCASIGSLRMIPISSANRNLVPNVGIKLTATVSYQTQEGLQFCQAQTTIKPDADQTLPAFEAGVSSSSVNPAPGQCGFPNAAGNFLACDCSPNNELCLSSPSCTVGGVCSSRFMNMVAFPGRPYMCTSGTGRASARLGILSTEPASLIFCNVDYAASGDAVYSGNFRLCTQLATGYGTFTTFATANSLGNQVKTGIALQGDGLPPGSYIFSARIIDSGQNQSNFTQKRFNVIDGCPLGWTNNFCPTGAYDVPDLCQNPNTCMGTKPPDCPSPGSITCDVPITDSCGRSCGTVGTMNCAQPPTSTPVPASTPVSTPMASPPSLTPTPQASAPSTPTPGSTPAASTPTPGSSPLTGSSPAATPNSTATPPPATTYDCSDVPLPPHNCQSYQVWDCSCNTFTNQWINCGCLGSPPATAAPAGCGFNPAQVNGACTNPTFPCPTVEGCCANCTLCGVCSGLPPNQPCSWGSECASGACDVWVDPCTTSGQPVPCLQGPFCR